VRAILTYPDDSTEHDFDIPVLEIEEPTVFTPESLYPMVIEIPSTCGNCNNVHLAVFKRQGFRLHDDGNVPVYRLVDVIP
jgi:hypothetical protein